MGARDPWGWRAEARLGGCRESCRGLARGGVWGWEAISISKFHDC